MMSDRIDFGRLALRREGEWWNAYFARTGTMEGAVLLGSIRISLVEGEERMAAKEAFMDLMRKVYCDEVERLVGQRPIWTESVIAPEHERAGHS